MRAVGGRRWGAVLQMTDDGLLWLPVQSSPAPLCRQRDREKKRETGQHLCGDGAVPLSVSQYTKDADTAALHVRVMCV